MNMPKCVVKLKGRFQAICVAMQDKRVGIIRLDKAYI